MKKLKIYIQNSYQKVNGVEKKFPPIFKIDNPDDPKKVESLHLTLDDIRDIGSFTSEGPETDLIKYKRKVNNAILEIKAYYFSRADITPENPKGIKEKQEDATSGVLCYLLQMLNNHCINFAGYEYDIQFLDAISDFINHYADIKGTKSAHKSRLPEAYTNLEEAMAYLKSHQEHLSLTDSLAELGSTVRDIADPLIRCVVQAVTPNYAWPLIETMTLENARDGIIRKKFIATVKAGIDWHDDPKIELSKSIVSDWIVTLIDYYLDVINLKSVKEIPSPAKTFALPDLARLAQLRKSASKTDKAEVKKIDAQLKQLRAIFASVDSFITLKLDAHQKFVKITNDAEMLERLHIEKWRTDAEANPGNDKAIAARTKRVMFELAEAQAQTYGIDNKLDGVKLEVKVVEESKDETVTTQPSPASVVHQDEAKENLTEVQQPQYPKNAAGQIAEIQQQIVLLQQQKKLSPELAEPLTKIVLVLLRMLTHFMMLSRDAASRAKAEEGDIVLQELCQDMLRYLGSNRDVVDAKNLLEEVQLKVPTTKNTFADVNTNPISAFFHRTTTTRSMLNEFLEECKAIERCPVGVVRLGVAS